MIKQGYEYSYTNDVTIATAFAQLHVYWTNDVK